MKTVPNNEDVRAFITSVSDEQRRTDCLYLLDYLQALTGKNPQMWGSSIVGFGKYHYKYESGREGDWFEVGFSPRKQNLSLYIMPNLEAQADLLKKLGKYKTGKSCLYIKKLSDIDESVLSEIILASRERLFKLYGSSDD